MADHPLGAQFAVKLHFAEGRELLVHSDHFSNGVVARDPVNDNPDDPCNFVPAQPEMYTPLECAFIGFLLEQRIAFEKWMQSTAPNDAPDPLTRSHKREAALRERSVDKWWDGE